MFHDFEHIMSFLKETWNLSVLKNLAYNNKNSSNRKTIKPGPSTILNVTAHFHKSFIVHQV